MQLQVVEGVEGRGHQPVIHPQQHFIAAELDTALQRWLGFQKPAGLEGALQDGVQTLRRAVDGLREEWVSRRRLYRRPILPPATSMT